MDPEAVINPKDRWQFGETIYKDTDTEWSVAEGRWKNEPVLAIRWNGKEGEPNPSGHPFTGGKPAWFILPAALQAAILNEIKKLKGTAEFSPKLTQLKAGFSPSHLAKLNETAEFRPPAKWRSTKVIYGDRDRDKEWLLAKGQWDRDKNDDWRDVLAIRWNKEGELGFPHRGEWKTWFIFPCALKAAIRAAIPNETA